LRLTTERTPDRLAATREIEGGGLYVNGQRQADADRRLTDADLNDDGTILLRRGKKTFHVLRVE
jgi:tyrosyl-tRNA synthetase